MVMNFYFMLVFHVLLVQGGIICMSLHKVVKWLYL